MIYDINERRFTCFGVSNIPEFHAVLRDHPVGNYIVENYRVRLATSKYSGHQHKWDTVVPVRVIGAIQYAAYLTGAEITLQEPNDKPLGYTLLGQTYVKGKKDVHHLDAAAHVAVWLHRKGEWSDGKIGFG